MRWDDDFFDSPAGGTEGAPATFVISALGDDNASWVGVLAGDLVCERSESRLVGNGGEDGIGVADLFCSWLPSGRGLLNFSDDRSRRFACLERTTVYSSSSGEDGVTQVSTSLVGVGVHGGVSISCQSVLFACRITAVCGVRALKDDCVRGSFPL